MSTSPNQPGDNSLEDLEENIDRIEQNIANNEGTVVGKIFAGVVNIFYDTPSRSSKNSKRVSVTFAGFTTILLTLTFLGIRSIGFLEAFELTTLDWLFQSRLQYSFRPPDKRIHIIEITNSDIHWLKENNKLISPESDQIVSDETILELLEKLERLDPKIIGLNIFRDIPLFDDEQGIKDAHNKLIRHIEDDRSIVSACFVSNLTRGSEGASLSDTFSENFKESLEYRSGFLDILSDGYKGGERVRRQLLYKNDLSKEAREICPAEKAFSFVLANLYLSDLSEVVKTHSDDSGLKYTHNKKEIYLKYLPTTQRPLVGGYHLAFQENDQFLETSQFLINYREANPIAETTTLKEILGGKRVILKDKIVLIGYTASDNASSISDYLNKGFYLTPYSKEHDLSTLMPGVHVQAHMVSQILSAVLDSRPLLGVLHPSIEIFIIICFSTLGGILAIYFWLSQNIGRKTIIFSSSLIIIFAPIPLGYYLFLQSIWFPIFPCLTVFLFTQAGVTFSIHSESIPRLILKTVSNEES